MAQHGPFTACYNVPEEEREFGARNHHFVHDIMAASPEELLRKSQAECPSKMELVRINWQGGPRGTHTVWAKYPRPEWDEDDCYLAFFEPR